MSETPLASGGGTLTQANIDALNRRLARQKSTTTTTSTAPTGLQTIKLQGASEGGVAIQPDTLVTTQDGKVVSQNTVPSSTSTTSKTQTSTPVPTYSAVEQKGVMSPTGEQSDKPYLRPDGSFDPNYIPKSEEEIMGLNADEYMTNKLFANYYKSKGFEFADEATPESFEEALKIFSDKQNKAKSQLEEQINESKKLAEEQKASAKSANQANLVGGREGVVSQGNMMTRDDIDLAFESRYNSQLRSLTQQMDNLKDQLAAQQAGLISGRGDQIRAQMAAVARELAAIEEAQAKKEQQSMAFLEMLSKNGALAGLDQDSLAYLQAAMPGAPPGVVKLLSDSATRQYLDERTKTSLENATKGIGMMKDLVSSGVVLNDTAMLSIAQQTGLPLDAIMSFNIAAESIMNDKNLDQATKAMNLQKLGYELDRQARGITNAELEKVDYLTNLYRSGASAEEIMTAKKVMGIKDEDDPMYRAELSLKQAQAEIERKRVNGEPISIDDQIKLLQAQEEYGDLGGYENLGGGSKQVVVSTKAPQGGIKVSYDDGTFKVTVPPNTEYQCGAFVNRVWGDRVFASAGTQKMAQIDKYGFKVKGASSEELAQKVKPGMAFVMPIANNQYDHVGFVQKVTPDGIITLEANADGRATTTAVGPGKNNITSRFIPWNQLYGFMAPPSNKTVGGATNNTFQKYFNEARESGLNVKEAKKLANERTKDKLTKDPDKKFTDAQFTQINQLYGRVKPILDEKRKLDEGFSYIQAYKNIPEKTSYTDQSLIFSYMKILDPGSVVRSDEFKTAEQYQGQLDKLGVTMDNIQGKALLTNDARDRILKIMTEKYKAQASNYNKELERQNQTIIRLGFSPDDVYSQDYLSSNADGGANSSFFGRMFNQMTGGGQNKPKPKVIDSYGDYYIPDTNRAFLSSNDI